MIITLKQYLPIGLFGEETIFYDKEQNRLLVGKQEESKFKWNKSWYLFGTIYLGYLAVSAVRNIIPNANLWLLMGSYLTMFLLSKLLRGFILKSEFQVKEWNVSREVFLEFIVGEQKKLISIFGLIALLIAITTFFALLYLNGLPAALIFSSFFFSLLPLLSIGDAVKRIFILRKLKKDISGG